MESVPATLTVTRAPNATLSRRRASGACGRAARRLPRLTNNRTATGVTPCILKSQEAACRRPAHRPGVGLSVKLYGGETMGVRHAERAVTGWAGAHSSGCLNLAGLKAAQPVTAATRATGEYEPDACAGRKQGRRGVRLLRSA